MLAQSIIGSAVTGSFIIPVAPSFSVLTTTLTANPNLSTGFLRRDYNAGAFNDDPNWFATQTPSSTLTDYFIDIGSSLDNVDNYSIQWTGYFVPPSNKNYIFRTTSDDGSYMWLGAEALSGFTTGNPIVNNGLAHGPNTVQSTNAFKMYTDHAYPIRFQYEEFGGGATMHSEWSNDGGANWNSFVTTCFHITNTGEGYLP